MAAREPVVADRPAETGDELPLLADWQRVTQRLCHALDMALTDVGLPAAEVNVLACLVGPRERPLRQLARATGRPASTLTGVLDRLERRGLIERRRDTADRRSLRITLTPAGVDVACDVRAAYLEIERRLRSPARARSTLAALDGAL